jgi:hypothetical protein
MLRRDDFHLPPGYARLADMHFDAFWTLVGTTAPVIALANVVSITVAFRLIRDFAKRPDFNAYQRSELRYGRTCQDVAYSLSLINLLCQALVLAWALESLSSGHNAISVSFVTPVEFGGLAAIAVVTLASAAAQNSASRLAETKRFLRELQNDRAEQSAEDDTPDDSQS